MSLIVPPDYRALDKTLGRISAFCSGRTRSFWRFGPKHARWNNLSVSRVSPINYDYLSVSLIGPPDCRALDKTLGRILASCSDRTRTFGRFGPKYA